MNTHNIQPLIESWYSTQLELKQLRKREVELRLEIVETLSTGEITEGTERIGIGHGKDLKITHKLTYKLDETDQLDLALDKVAKVMGEEIADRLVNFKPTLSVSEFKKLDDDVLKEFSKFVTTIPGTPSIEIVDEK